MKLMSYNILDGAVKTIPLIIDIVKKESPDYLSVNEANSFAKDNNKVLQYFAHETGFPYFDIALSGEYDYHVAAFSKYPFKGTKKLQPLARACLITEVESPFGPISIASLHLTPYSEDLRHPEIDLVLNNQKAFENRVLMGDMNSLSSYDNYDNKMIKDFNHIQLKKFVTSGMLRYDAIDKILSTGYFDTAQKTGKNSITTVPTPINKDSAHAKMRLDYIFLSKSLLPHLKDYEVIKNEKTDIASDHYPIKVVLE